MHEIKIKHSDWSLRQSQLTFVIDQSYPSFSNKIDNWNKKQLKYWIFRQNSAESTRWRQWYPRCSLRQITCERLLESLWVRRQAGVKWGGRGFLHGAWQHWGGAHFTNAQKGWCALSGIWSSTKSLCSEKRSTSIKSLSHGKPIKTS